MIAKKTSKNQLTLPADIVKKFPGIRYFDIEVEDSKIIMTPVTIQPLDSGLDKIRVKMERLGMTENDIDDAVQWARKSKNRG